MMSPWVEFLSSNSQTIVSLLAQPTMASIGLLPKLGPGRAFFLAVRSRIKGPKRYKTIRTEELAHLRSQLETLEPDQYLVITGPKGVGKSILLDTLLSHRAGVIRKSVAPGTDTDTIVHTTLLEITGRHPSIFAPQATARRVILCYRFLQYLPHLMLAVATVTAANGLHLALVGSASTYWFGVAGVSLVAALLLSRLSPGLAPVVVLRASERNSKKTYADITGAVRDLRDPFEVDVIVDGSPNSLEYNLFHTNREIVYYVQPLSREQIKQLPQFDRLPSDVKEDTELCDIIWEVLGGNPSKYDQLLAFSKPLNDKRKGVQDFLIMELENSRQTIGDAKSENKDMKEILQLLKFENSNIIPIPQTTLEIRNLKRSHLDKVLRLSKDKQYLFPATSAIALLLQYKLQKVPTWEELKTLLGKSTKAIQ